MAQSVGIDRVKMLWPAVPADDEMFGDGVVAAAALVIQCGDEFHSLRDQSKALRPVLEEKAKATLRAAQTATTASVEESVQRYTDSAQHDGSARAQLFDSVGQIVSTLRETVAAKCSAEAVDRELDQSVPQWRLPIVADNYADAVRALDDLCTDAGTHHHKLCDQAKQEVKDKQDNAKGQGDVCDGDDGDDKGAADGGDAAENAELKTVGSDDSENSCPGAERFIAPWTLRYYAATSTNEDTGRQEVVFDIGSDTDGDATDRCGLCRAIIQQGTSTGQGTPRWRCFQCRSHVVCETCFLITHATAAAVGAAERRPAQLTSNGSSFSGGTSWLRHDDPFAVMDLEALFPHALHLYVKETNKFYILRMPSAAASRGSLPVRIRHAFRAFRHRPFLGIAMPGIDPSENPEPFSYVTYGEVWAAVKGIGAKVVQTVLQNHIRCSDHDNPAATTDSESKKASPSDNDPPVVPLFPPHSAFAPVAVFASTRAVTAVAEIAVVSAGLCAAAIDFAATAPDRVLASAKAVGCQTMVCDEPAYDSLMATDAETKAALVAALRFVVVPDDPFGLTGLGTAAPSSAAVTGVESEASDSPQATESVEAEAEPQESQGDSADSALLRQYELFSIRSDGEAALDPERGDPKVVVLFSSGTSGAAPKGVFLRSKACATDFDKPFFTHPLRALAVYSPCWGTGKTFVWQMFLNGGMMLFPPARAPVLWPWLRAARSTMTLSLVPSLLSGLNDRLTEHSDRAVGFLTTALSSTSSSATTTASDMTIFGLKKDTVAVPVPAWFPNAAKTACGSVVEVPMAALAAAVANMSCIARDQFITAWAQAIAAAELHADLGWYMAALGVGGAAVPRQVVRDLNAVLPCRVIETYGSTEAGGVGSADKEGYITPDGEASTKIVSRPDLGFELTDDPPRGELMIKATMSASRSDAFGATRDMCSDDGWVTTGDLVEVHPKDTQGLTADGRCEGIVRFRIAGRAAGTVKLPCGVFVAADAMETALQEDPTLGSGGLWVVGLSPNTGELAAIRSTPIDGVEDSRQAVALVRSLCQDCGFAASPSIVLWDSDTAIPPLDSGTAIQTKTNEASRSGGPPSGDATTVSPTAAWQAAGCITMSGKVARTRVLARFHDALAEAVLERHDSDASVGSMGGHDAAPGHADVALAMTILKRCGVLNITEETAVEPLVDIGFDSAMFARAKAILRRRAPLFTLPGSPTVSMVDLVRLARESTAHSHTSKLQSATALAAAPSENTRTDECTVDGAENRVVMKASDDHGIDVPRGETPDQGKKDDAEGAVQVAPESVFARYLDVTTLTTLVSDCPDNYTSLLRIEEAVVGVADALSSLTTQDLPDLMETCRTHHQQVAASTAGMNPTFDTRTELAAGHNDGKPAPNAVLLTGATGYYGRHILRSLLSAPPESEATTVVCIVRGKSVEAATQRLKAALDTTLGPAIPDECFAARVVVVAGDLTQPLFGLHPDDVMKLRIRTIIHAGAMVFSGQLVGDDLSREAVVQLAAANAVGTLNAATIATLCRLSQSTKPNGLEGSKGEERSEDPPAVYYVSTMSAHTVAPDPLRPGWHDPAQHAPQPNTGTLRRCASKFVPWVSPTSSLPSLPNLGQMETKHAPRYLEAGLEQLSAYGATKLLGEVILQHASQCPAPSPDRDGDDSHPGNDSPAVDTAKTYRTVLPITVCRCGLLTPPTVDIDLTAAHYGAVSSATEMESEGMKAVPVNKDDWFIRLMSTCAVLRMGPEPTMCDLDQPLPYTPVDVAADALVRTLNVNDVTVPAGLGGSEAEIRTRYHRLPEGRFSVAAVLRTLGLPLLPPHSFAAAVRAYSPPLPYLPLVDELVSKVPVGGLPALQPDAEQSCPALPPRLLAALRRVWVDMTH